MAEAVAGLLTSAFVNIAKDKLGSVIGDKANLLCSFSDDLESMKDVLETISAALEDAERRSVEERLVRLWLKRLKDAAYDISDILEECRDTTDQETAKMRAAISCLPRTYKKISLANRMKTVRENLSNIYREIGSLNFILKQGTCTTVIQPCDKRETTSYLREETIIPRDREKQEIIKLLSTNTNNNRIVIVPIYGLGGLGKSTLAQLVYNDNQFKKYDHRLWVYVSQHFNLLKIGSSIINQLPTEGSQPSMDTQQAINNYLSILLHNKKVLIVLDDLWEEQNDELDKLRIMLQVKESMIDVIVTTRKKEIAMKVSTGKEYELERLKDTICWEIIKRSSKFHLKSNKGKLEEIGLDIANKCRGVALAAQTIGFMLQSVDDVYGWTKINNSGLWNGSSKDDKVLPSLMLSYERMQPLLRACFSYCAIFPKGHNIVEDDLIHQWTAIDLIDGDPSKGKEYINELLGMSFLQVSKLPSTSKEHAVRYTMHDLVHDLAKLTIEEELLAFDVATNSDVRAQIYCRYLLLRKYDGTKKLEDILPPKMRALRFSDSGNLSISSSAFSFAKWLRTLDFSECSGILLPDSIGRLKHLRCLIAPRMQNRCLPKFITELSKLQYLNINGSSQISALPESIGKLGRLKFLGLSGCSSISKLPKSFGDLKCMVHLDMSGCSRMRHLPESLGNLTNLQHLNLSRCSRVQAIPESLHGLTQLQYLDISCCYSIDPLPEAIGSLFALQYLNMSDCSQIRELPESLENLQNLLHLDLSSLTEIRELRVLRGLTGLEHLNMSYSSWRAGSKGIDVLENLTNLKYLSLRYCGLKEVGNDRNPIDFIGTLTNLEHLDLSSNHELVCLPESIGNLKRLHTLKLNGCHGLKSLPEILGALGLKSLMLERCSKEVMDQASSLVHYSRTLPDFRVRVVDDANGRTNLPLLEGAHDQSELRILSLENARSLEEAKAVNLVEKHNLSSLTLGWSARGLLEDNDLLGQLEPPSGLKNLKIRGYNGTSFPAWVSDHRHLTNLVFIHLWYLPECRHLPPLGQLPCLERIILHDLPSVTKIDRKFCGGKDAFRTLSSFSMSRMDGLEEWNTTYSTEDGVVEAMFPVLDHLRISFCPRLMLKPCPPPTFRKWELRSSDQVISSLEELEKASHASSAASGGIKLDLNIQGDKCQSMRVFHHFPALQELSIQHRNLTSLPESMRHLTSLQLLELKWCSSISALPDWLGDLPALKRIEIRACENIKYLSPCLPQVQELCISYTGVTTLPESICHLTSLQSLELEYCEGISALPEWLGDLSSLKRIKIIGCWGIKCLPTCIKQLKRLEKLEIMGNQELKKWCESEENNTRLAHIDIECF